MSIHVLADSHPQRASGSQARNQGLGFESIETVREYRVDCDVTTHKTAAIRAVAVERRSVAIVVVLRMGNRAHQIIVNAVVVNNNVGHIGVTVVDADRIAIIVED